MRLNIIVFFFFFFIKYSYGVNDKQFWTSTNFEAKLPHFFNLELEQGFKLTDQASPFKQNFFELSLSYKIFDNLNINIPYRFIILKDKTRHRLSFGGSYKLVIKPISMGYRIKYQRTNESGESSKNLIRNKFTIEYKLNKIIEPYISWELFYDKTRNDYFSNNRVSIGFSFSNLPQKNSLKIFYIIKKEGTTKSNIIGLSYRNI